MMLAGEKLGAALVQAMKLKGVGPNEVATHFGIKPPSVKDWQKRGCIGKQHLGKLIVYFGDTVPPSHWGVEALEAMAFLSGIPGHPHNHVRGGDQNVLDGETLVRTVDDVRASIIYTPNAESVTTSRLAPVLAWARLGVDLYTESSGVDAAQFEPVPNGATQLVKWFVVEQDFHRFGINKGDLVALDPMGPADQPEEMKRHVFKTAAGNFILGEYRTLASGFEVLPDNGQPMDKDRHGLTVVARVRGVWQR